jgi:hypothetical protein
MADNGLFTIDKFKKVIGVPTLKSTFDRNSAAMAVFMKKICNCLDPVDVWTNLYEGKDDAI